LLTLFPAHFRGDFGGEMTDVFRDQHRDASLGDPMALMRLWWDTLGGILTTAPREHVDLLRSDVRYALRNLRRSPGFTAVAVIALAAGIGANTAVFSIVNGVLLSALPCRSPGELVAIFEKVPGAPVDKFDLSTPDFEIIRDAAQSYSGMFAYRNNNFELSGVAESQRAVGSYVSPDFLACSASHRHSAVRSPPTMTAATQRSSCLATVCGRGCSAAIPRLSAARSRSTGSRTPSSA
jgi:hypothetical protein